MNRNDYIQYIERALQDLDVDALRFIYKYIFRGRGK